MLDEKFLFDFADNSISRERHQEVERACAEFSAPVAAMPNGHQDDKSEQKSFISKC